MLQRFIDAMPTADTLCNVLHWFKKAVPNPDRQNFNTQLGVHVEEFGEMLDEMSGQTPHGVALIEAANKAAKELAQWLKTNPNGVVIRQENRKNFLDALCDQVVTATGTGYMIGMNLPGGMAEQVNPSNFSKFCPQTGEPFFDANRKITKGPAYIKADLSNYV